MDDRESDAALRSTSSVTWLAQLLEGRRQREVVQDDPTSMMSTRTPAAWMTSRGDEYDVDEDTGGVDDIK